MAPEPEEECLTPPPSPPRKRKRDQSTIEELEVDVTAPEPPSKKALRKAKKGKIVPSAKAAKPTISEIHQSDSDDKEVPAQTVPAKRSEHGIWIGNLPWTATKSDLRNFFTKDTDITEEMITRVHMPAPSEAANAASRQKIKPQNKGFAYVDFSTATPISEALALSETLLTGRRVLIKDSKSFAGRPEKAKEEDVLTTYSGKPPSKRIFVGNLGFDATKEGLHEHFARCGEIADVHVATFEDSGKCKGYAWVEFEEQEGGEAAVRGWVNHEENEDIEDEEGGKDGSDEVQEEKTKPKRKPKLRKWWVNKFKGRPLRMEFAEDKAIRYKKRYGKDGTAKTNQNSREDPTEATSADTTQPPDESHSSTKPRPQRTYPPRKVDARTIKPGAALAAAPRLTGGIVPSLGKKIVFT